MYVCSKSRAPAMEKSLNILMCFWYASRKWIMLNYQVLFMHALVQKELKLIVHEFCIEVGSEIVWILVHEELKFLS